MDERVKKLPYAYSFRDLIVYQKSRQLASEIFETTQRFPAEERYAITDQIRRASRSVGAQVAEAWAKRRYEKHFISKLTDADGEQFETQHWIEIAQDCGYLQTDQAERLIGLCQEIGRLLNGMMMKSDRFCGNYSSLREHRDEYFTDTQIDPEIT